MPKNISPPKNTGGGGYSFEDNIAAYFLSCLLSGHPPFSQVPGTINDIYFQVRVDGWLLDDALLTLRWQGETSQAALSFKSNKQFTTKSAPKDFVRTVWEQFLHEGTDKFDQGQDTQGIVVSPLAPNLSTDVQTLLRFAREEPSARLPSRLHTPGFTSKRVRNIFDSFACPQDLAIKYGIRDEHIGELLAHVQVLEADFDKGRSTWYGDAIRNCRAALRDPTPENTMSLWQALLNMSKQYRPSAGHLDFATLRALLPSTLQLAGLPNYSNDWLHLLEGTEAEISCQADKIGHTVHLSRRNEHEAIVRALEHNNAVALLGTSGSGKSALAKQIALMKRAAGTVLWLNAQSLDEASFAAFQTALDLNYPLREVLTNVPSTDALFILDGVDRIYNKPALQNLSILLDVLRLGQENSPWKLLLPCQLEAWQRIQYVLAQAELYAEEVQIAEPVFEELDPVWEAFPNLRRLRLRPDLQSLLRKPKVLDLLATKLRLGQGIDPTLWVGESDLIEWFWQVEVSQSGVGDGRATCLQLLAEKQADDLRLETPLVDCSACDGTVLRNVIQDGLCKEREGRVSFEHDLYGDWFRQRILVARFGEESPDALRQYFDETRLGSPLWHRALRLYGLYLIEKYPQSERWRKTFHAMSAPGAEGSVEQDLLLQALIFAADPLQLLERLWGDLSDNNGALLRRLLGTFLQVATLPNKAFLEAVKQSAPRRATEAATLRRIPIPVYWAPMIQFLHAHKIDVLEQAPHQLAQIVDQWLNMTHESMPLRREAADMALDLADIVLGGHYEGQHRSDLAQISYHATLAAAVEHPERVATFALKASSRLQPPGEGIEEDSRDKGTSPELAAYVSEHPERASLFRDFGVEAGHYELTPGWPDGPFSDVDEDFRYVCLQTDALYPLITNNPAVACEVLLALLIEPPRERHLFADHLLDDLEISHVEGWYPPIYTDGPFLYFLMTRPSEALETILRLVSFATEQWADAMRKKHREPWEVITPGQVGQSPWLGDSTVYYWYEDEKRELISVIAALQALEKWLYDELAANRSIERWLDIILDGSSSVAFAGVLSAVARKEPTLLTGRLEVLLGVPEFLIWENEHIVARKVNGTGIMMGFLFLRDKQTLDALLEWRSMPHRDKGLDDWAVYYFLTNGVIRRFLERERLQWIERLRRDPGLTYFAELLVPKFDLSNYRRKPDGGIVYIPPAEVRTKLDTSKAENRLNIGLFPHQCRHLLEGDSDPALADDQAEAIWHTISYVHELAQSPDNELSEVGLRDAVCGGIAVLFRKGRDWLESHPDREGWCLERIVEALETPVAPGFMEDKWSLIGWRWDRFIARTLPGIWTEDVTDPARRQLIATLALSPSYETVAVLFASAAEVRDSLGSAFGELQHLITHLAVARLKSEHPEWNNHLKLDVDTYVGDLIERFVSGELPSEIPTWESIIESCTEVDTLQPGSEVRARKHSRRRPELDIYLLKAAYSWLPSLKDARTQAERTEWIEIRHQMLRYLLHMLGAEHMDAREVGGTPQDWDYWVLKQTVFTLLELDPDEDPRSFWQPILELDARGRYWVEAFLRDWFLQGLRLDPMPDSFLRVWQAMVEHAFQSASWMGDTKSSHYMATLWIHLLGIDSTNHDRWVARHTDLVTALKPLFERWARVYLPSADCTRAFLRFLQEPAAEGMLLEGLTWIDQVRSQLGSSYWGDSSHRRAMTALLDYAWQSYPDALRGQTDAFGAFRRLLIELANYQDAWAIGILNSLER